MQFQTFVRKPFVVDAVEITEDNIAEVANLIGVLRKKENGTPYIAVNRRLVPNLFRVYPGFWMTKMGDNENIRCYSKRVFEQQFVANDPVIENWVTYINGDSSDTTPLEEVVSISADVVDPEEDAYAN